MQTTALLPFVGSFFARRGEKRTYKEENYHAAAG
jgi:hypothetical protein